MTAESRPPTNRKDLRGFENPTIAKLLAPAAVKLTDKYVTAPYEQLEIMTLFCSYLAALRNGTAKVKNKMGTVENLSGAHARVFQYRNDEYDPEDPLKGYLKGELLVKVRPFCICFIGYLRAASRRIRLSFCLHRLLMEGRVL